jgi:protein TonB
MKSSLVSAVIHAVFVSLVMLLTPHVVHTRERPREWPNVFRFVSNPPAVIDRARVGRGGFVVCRCILPKIPGPPPIPIRDIATAIPALGAGPDTIWEHSEPQRGGGGEQESSGVLSADAVGVQVTPYPGAPTPRYPEALREAGIEGEVTLEFVVDTTGRVDAGSVRVISTPADAFVVSIRDALAATRYHPALVGGQRVRQLVRQGFVFSLTQH